jgi:hypothetical protein
MSCLDYALNGKCCICYEKVEGGESPHLNDGITKMWTRSGVHYACQSCVEKYREKKERGEIDVFEVECDCSNCDCEKNTQCDCSCC